MRLFSLYYIVVMLVLVGCMSKHQEGTFMQAAPSAGNQHLRPITKAQAEEIALKEASKVWKDKHLEIVSIGHLDQHWSVDVYWKPLTPGGFVTIEISETGEVIRVMPGE